MILASLVRAPGVAESVQHLAGPTDVVVESIRLIPRLTGLDAAPPGSIAVVGPLMADGSSPVHVDLALREAVSRQVAAIILLTDSPDLVGSTGRSLAERGGVAILWAPVRTDVADLLFRLRAALDGGGMAAVSQLGLLVDVLEEAELVEASAGELIQAANAVLETPVEFRQGSEQPGDGTVVTIRDVAEGHIRFAAGAGEDDGEIGRAIRRLVADALGRVQVRTLRREEASIESRAEMLTELLMTDPAQAALLLSRIREADIPIDGWHVAVRLNLHGLELAGDELAQLDATAMVSRLAIDSAKAGGGHWYRAATGSKGLLLVRMDRSEPGSRAAATAALVAGRVINRVRSQLPFLQLLCGVGAVHPGVGGLRTTVTEAEAAAAAARTGGRFDEPLLFDAVGLRRMLVEWYASGTTRKEIDALLAPLDALDPRRAATAIETLRSFLDNQGSLSRTGADLHLHRNAVSYRLKWIRELLGVDLDDPDERLILHLACRARSFA